MPPNGDSWIFLDIALRVPPIILMDVLLKQGTNPPVKTSHDVAGAVAQPTEEGSVVFFDFYRWFTIVLMIAEEIVFFFLSIFLYAPVFITAIFVLLFSTKQLVSIYMRLASIAIVFVSYIFNVHFIDSLTQHRCRCCPRGIESVLYTPFFNTTIQVMLAVFFSNTSAIDIVPTAFIWLLFLTPTLSTGFLPLPLLQMMPTITATVCLILLTYSIWIHGLSVCEIVYKGVSWCHNAVESYGLFAMLESHWVNLHIPQVFGFFWIIRLAEYVFAMIGRNKIHTMAFSTIVRDITVFGSDNIIGLLGMTSVVGFVCEQFAQRMQNFLLVSKQDQKKIGNVSAALFLILSLQTGITGLDPDVRYKRIIRNCFLLYTAMMHFVYNILNPILLSLNASINSSKSKHIRALLACFCLIVTPSVILVHQWNSQTTNTWLLAVTCFMIELVVKTLASLLIYILFIIDAYRNGLWEKLDDYVYYLTAASSLVEFTIGVYLLLNGMWIFAFESAGAIRACMMCLHAYFNIWIQANNGWESFLTRRSALNKINVLPEATPEQLKSRNDRCAICYHEMKTARITRCNHYFHGVCLRKWLNVQDKCPLCHTMLYDANVLERSRRNN